jgi:hypothetical protein
MFKGMNGRRIRYLLAAFMILLSMTVSSFPLNVQAVSTLPVKVNCGGSGADGLAADQAYTTGSWGYTAGSVYAPTDSVTNNYGYPTGMQSQRYAKNFSYKFDVPNGNFTIKLYFAERFYTSTGKRVFNVDIEGVRKLTNLDVYAVAGHDTGLERVYTGIAVTDGVLQIDFADTINDNAIVNVIVVEQEGATPTPTQTPTPTATPTPTPTPTATPTPGSVTRYEAENYSNQSGTITYSDVSCSGGNCVGNYDLNDWTEYNNVNIPANGTYTINFRVASLNAGTQFQLKEGATVLCTVDVGNTGGWFAWTIVAKNLNLTAGVKTWRIVSHGLVKVQ